VKIPLDDLVRHVHKNPRKELELEKMERSKKE
jgi:hypothetical protein